MTLLALFFLNLALTLQNVWPTLKVRWVGECSVDLAALLFVLALLSTRPGLLKRGHASILAVLLLLLTLGRYVDETAPALYGRPINLYWDLPHVGSVIGMVTTVMSGWLLAAGIVAAIVLLALLYLLLRLAIRQVIRAMEDRRWRLGLGTAAALLLLSFAAQGLDDRVPKLPEFAHPVSLTFAEQAMRIRDAMADSRAVQELPASPPLQRDFSVLAGSDVVVLLLESYGRSTYDRPEFAKALRGSRAVLAADIADTGRKVVSAFIESPTFGGNSWLAQITLMAGIEVRDQQRYDLLLTQQRESLSTAFKARGYRSVAVMPGLRLSWPEGSFYRFDTIYGADALDYKGPEFGWWRIPDQYALARVDQLEVQRSPRAPLFVFYPTISTHLPFRPVPPYQADWQRVLTPDPFDAVALHESLAQEPEWTNLGRAYVDAMSYSFATIGGYLRTRPAAPLVLIVLGDHQPAASVTGEGASWDVPVHVITDNDAVIAALMNRGFSAGLEPAETHLGPMQELTTLLLDALSTAPTGP